VQISQLLTVHFSPTVGYFLFSPQREHNSDIPVNTLCSPLFSGEWWSRYCSLCIVHFI